MLVIVLPPLLCCHDATALTAYTVAVAAATGAAMPWGSGIVTFLLASAGGTLIGDLIGVVVHWIRLRLHDSVLESGLGILVPFGAYLIGETAHTSGVLAVVAAGLYLGHNAPRAGYATRLRRRRSGARWTCCWSPGCSC